MTRKGTKSQLAVERLLEQQRQYQDWLDKLDADAKHAAPSHVTDRVRSDYAARLEAVTKELAEHVEAVREALVQSTVRFEGLSKQRDARSDELAEAKLRRQVGEFDEEAFDEVSERCKTALAELAKEIAAAERDIERYEEILGLIEEAKEEEEEEEEEEAPVERIPAPPPVAAAPPPPPPPPPPPTPPPAPPPAPEPAKPVPMQVDALDELAFLRSVVAKPESSKAAPPPVSEPLKRVSSPAIAPPPMPKAAPSPPPPPPAPPPPPPAPEPPPAARSAPAPVEPLSAEPEETKRPPVGAKGGGGAGAERASEGQVKTLKCTECGTMNLPTEWYCEKCGAELSAF